MYGWMRNRNALRFYSLKLSRLLNHGDLDGADAFDAAFHGFAFADRANTCGGAGEDQVAGHERVLFREI